MSELRKRYPFTMLYGLCLLVTVTGFAFMNSHSDAVGCIPFIAMAFGVVLVAWPIVFFELIRE